MELTDTQKRKIEEVAEDYNLRFVVLHGSYATGRNRPGSDLDIAVMGKNKLSYSEIDELFHRFGEIFGNNREREIDIKPLGGVDPLFRYQVVKESQLLYGGITDFNEFKAYAERAYEEAKPLFKLESVIVEKKIKNLVKEYS